MGQKIRGQVHSEGKRLPLGPLGTKPGPREREPRKKGYSMGWSGDRSMSFWEMLLAFMISECVSIKWQKGSQCGGEEGREGSPCNDPVPLCRGLGLLQLYRVGLARPLFQSLAFLPRAPVPLNEGSSNESTVKKKESDILIVSSLTYLWTQGCACNSES